MALTYSNHARQRMAERGITEADVEWAIQTGNSRGIEEGKTLYNAGGPMLKGDGGFSLLPLATIS